MEGIDGVLIGPGDLAASLGHVGEPSHPIVMAAVEDAIRRLVASGKPSGIFTPDRAFTIRCMELGALFAAAGSDVGVLARGTERLRQDFPMTSKPV